MNAHVYSYRGGLIENRHRVSVAIVNPKGELVAYAGNPNLAVPMRSSSKPFQAQALFLSGAVEKFSINPEEISVSCASHDGTARHLEVVAGYLEKIGLGVEYLACGTHLPSDAASLKALQDSGQAPTAIYNNCSGKHTGMLATALALGVDPKGYELPSHPVQQLNLQIIRDLSGLSEVPYGIDGCSVPAFIPPLAPAARMFAQLADPASAPAKYQAGLQKTYESMRAFPEMVAGPQSMDTVLMQRLPNIAIKRGAEGYGGIALRDTKWGPLGITLKVEDGSSVAREPFVVELLEQLGILSPDEPMEWRKPIIRNVKGLEVGYIEPRIELTWA